MKLLHVRLAGWTATFRLPLIYSGTGLTAPMPPYSTLLGLVGNLLGRQIEPHETRIGYVFRSSGTSYDLETTRRLEMQKDGRLKSQTVPGIAKRQFHTNPILDLYLDNTSFREAFEYPANAPCMGRSQDLAWLTEIAPSTRVEEVEAEPRTEGIVRGTLIPFPQPGATGVILPLPDYINNDQTGFTREVGRVSKFQAVRYETPARIARPDLFHADGMADDEVVYLRSLVA
jgi:CRISPR-associated protein Cas5t